MTEICMYAQGVVTCQSVEDAKADEAVSTATRSGYTAWKINQKPCTSRRDRC